MKTYMHKTADVSRQWHQMDAKDQVLGRLAVEVAKKLVGKHKKTYTPHIDDGDYVVVINAADVVVTGNKTESKQYYRHSGHPGSLKSRTLGEQLERHPEEVIRKAVYNMVPKNRLRRGRMARLKIYAGAEHKHASQLAEKKTEKKEQ